MLDNKILTHEVLITRGYQDVTFIVYNLSITETRDHIMWDSPHAMGFSKGMSAQFNFNQKNEDTILEAGLLDQSNLSPTGA